MEKERGKPMNERKPQKLYEEIVERMIVQIQEGTLRPGDRLPSERMLAETYGVSRTVIREALRALAMMGCVESRVGEGTYIKAPAIADIVNPFSMVVQNNLRMGGELIEARLILETEVAALSARRRNEAQLAALDQTIEDMRTDIAAGGMGLEADERFHMILTEAAGNEALRAMLGMCSDMLSRTRPITQSVKGVPQKAMQDHAAILQAVRDGDASAARRLMRIHLNRALRNLNRADR